jgi:hypothetical protein
VRHLRGLKQLQLLNLSLCSNVTDAAMPHVAKLTALQALDLSSCRVSNRGLAIICADGALTELRRLSLDCNDEMDENFDLYKESFYGYAPRGFRSANDDCSGDDGDGAEENEDEDDGDRRSRRDGCSDDFSDDDFGGRDDGDGRRVTNAGLVHIAKLKKLVQLKLAWCGISDAKHLAGLPLEDLSVEGCIRLTDASLKHIASIKTLKKLSIAHCGLISGAALIKHAPTLPALVSICTRGCNRIGDFAFHQLETLCPKCEVDNWADDWDGGEYY